MTLLIHEIKMNVKALIIWTTCVGVICFGCLLLFESLETTMEQMSDMYAQMGAFSTAFGMDKLSISTLEGFYATEIGIMFAIGGAMFAAMTGAGMVAKEEEGHTSEFLCTLPFGRNHILFSKYIAMAVLILVFNLVCILWVLLGFACMGDMPSEKEFLLYHGSQLFMQLEVGSICFLISSICKRRQTGMALGFAVLLYLMDMLSRVLPDLENLKYVTPYYFSNASDIFSDGTVDCGMLGISIGVILISLISAVVIYHKRDLAA